MSLRLISFLILLGTMPLMATANSNEPPQDNGYYLLDSAEDLKWFANHVNDGNTSANAKLCADIVVDGWTPIGGTRGYAGTFDGQGYRVAVRAVITNEEDIPEITGNGFFGLFSVNYGIIKNVSCECHFITSVEDAEILVGGIAASNGGTVSNCYTTLVYAEYCCGTNVDVGAIVGENIDGNVSNCYYLEGTAQNAGGGISKTSYQFASGEVAWLLQNGVTAPSENEPAPQVWGQNIDNGQVGQDYPVHYDNNTVYQVSNCHVHKTYSNDSQIIDSYENGICNVCGAYEPAEELYDVYQITNAGNLYWFAALVNAGNTSANAKLMNDIVVNRNVLVNGELNGVVIDFLPWTPIGTNVDNSYLGTFDGQGHTISGLYFNSASDNVGLFGSVGKGEANPTISNVGVIDSYFNANKYVGGIVGYCYKSTVTNCYNTGSVSGVSDGIGGIAGKITDATVSNCYNTGYLKGTNAYSGGIVGANFIGTVSNCYYLEGTAQLAGGGISKTSYQFASGEVAYLLNGNQENLVWRQNIDNEEEVQFYPVLKGAKVYQVQTTCSSEEKAYSNNTSSVAHAYENGFCPCGACQEPQQDNNVYQIANAGNLYWFAALVNENIDVIGQTAQNTSANAKLTANITVNDGYTINSDGTVTKGGNTYQSLPTDFRTWTPIGYVNSYLGTFDGGNHTISGLYYNNSDNSYVGLFGSLGNQDVNATIQNVGVIDSYFKALSCVGGIVGNCNSSTVSNCYNTGSVIATTTNTILPAAAVGGIVGHCNVSTISNCYNTGSVAGIYRVGGIVGYDVSYVDGPSSGISNCYYLVGTATTTQQSPNTYGTSKSSQEFASGEVAYLLQNNANPAQTAQVWGQNINNGQTPQNYPVFSDARVYKVNNSYTNLGEDNIIDDNIYWLYENGVLTIEGAGLIPGYSEDQDKPWKEHLDNINTVVVKAGITGIGDNAFSDIVNPISLFYYRSTKPENWGNNWIKSGSTVYVPASWTVDKVGEVSVTKMPTYTGTWSTTPNANSHVVINSDLVLGQQSVSSKTTDNSNVLTVSSFGLTESGSITIKAGEQKVNDELIDYGGQLICEQANGEVTVEKTIYTPKWYTISSPLEGSVEATSVTNLIDGTTPANYALYRYDEPSYTWENYKLASNNFTTLDAGRGYLYARSGSSVTTLQFKGEINTEPVEYTLTANGTTLSGFHLIGNPFTHNITSTNLSVPTGVTLAEGYYVLSNQGSWETYLENTGEIKPGQGALIKASVTGSDATLTIKNTASSKGQEPRAKSQEPMLALNVTNGNYSDRAFVIFGKGVGLDKINHQNEEIPMLYIPMSDADYAIAMMDESVNEIPVGFESSSMGQFTITLKQENCEFEELYLLDKETGAKVNILEEGYTFMATSGDNAERFTLIKAQGSQPEAQSNFAYISNNDIVIYDIKGNVQVDIYDVMGRRVYNANGRDDMHIVNTDGYSAGVYVIRIMDENGLRTQKVVIE